ncbi:hypothetical protein HUN08_13205 [Gordonia sp. X0973]|uniref:hypothetical protein n=1 Tax=Gordonia sp. X0973 TaxID=2742602 RepID=UPI000F5492C4|nr:hypothetical protein [Gordonia sp. X0973]QKT08033.1 hypothetical protein HUN08_13205 [Gordonia sp. X0973]
MSSRFDPIRAEVVTLGEDEGAPRAAVAIHTAGAVDTEGCVDMTPSDALALAERIRIAALGALDEERSW